MSEQPDPQQSALPVRFRERWLSIAFFFLLSAVIVYATIAMIAPFIVPILLAGVIVIFTYPMYVRLTKRLGGKGGLAAGVMVLFMVAAVIVPALILGALLIDQAVDLVNMLQTQDVAATIRNLHVTERVTEIADRIPGVDPRKIDVGGAVYGMVKGVPGFVAARGGQVFAGVVGAIVDSFLMVLAMLFFYTDGRSLIDQIKDLSPLTPAQNDELVAKIKGVVNATLRGQGLTAIGQGIATGIGLAVTGVPGSFFWGAVSIVVSLVPLVGAGLVWVSGSVYLFWVGGLGWRPIFLFLWGALVVSTIDNIIRPWAMKGGTEMNGIVLLFSILAGMKAFGFLGILLGPLVVVLLISVIGIYRDLFVDVGETSSVER